MPTTRRASARKQPLQERSRATVEAILDATALLLVQEGFERTTTRRIAEKAGVSIGSFYQYFPSKEALLLALAERHLQRLQALVGEQLQPTPELSPQEAVRRLVRGLIQAYAVNPRLYQVLFEQGPRFGLMEHVRSLEEGISWAVRDYLRHYQELLRPTQLDLASFVLLHASRGVIWGTLSQHPHLVRDPALEEELSVLILRYLMK